MAESHPTVVVRHPSLPQGTHLQTVRVVRILMVVDLRATRVNGAQPASLRQSRRCVFLVLVARTPPFAAPPPNESGHYVLRTH
jgi:hypothetical protein